MDLKEKFGKKFKIFMDESYEAEQEEGKTFRKWQYQEIRGKYGRIYLFGIDQPAITFTSIFIANKMRPWAGKIIQDGTYERTFLIKTEDIPKMANAIQARKKRQVSEEMRQKLIIQLQKARKIAP